MTKELSPAMLATMNPEALVELANDSAEQSFRRIKEAVHFAVNAGLALNAAKEQTPHGQWARWLKANWNYSHDWANKLMRLAANSDRGMNLDTATSVKSALRLLEDSREPDHSHEPDVSFLSLSRQSRFYDERLLADDAIGFGSDARFTVLIQPSMDDGHAYVGYIDRKEDSVTFWKRPIRRDAVVGCLEVTLPDDCRSLEWEVEVTSTRYEAGFYEINPKENPA